MSNVWENCSRRIVDGKREYEQWASMRKRCKAGSVYQSRKPTYIGCTFDPRWESYDVWYAWASHQTGFLDRDEAGRVYELDKDVLGVGNHYAPETCVFIPRQINIFFGVKKRSLSGLPLGVSKQPHKTKPYLAQARLLGRGTYLGSHETPELAFAAYSSAKVQEAKMLALKYAGLVDQRVIEALNNYTVNIND